MFEKIVNIIAEELNCDENTITENSGLADDLGADSLDIVKILMGIEENFGVVVPDEEILNLRTVRDIISYVEINM